MKDFWDKLQSYLDIDGDIWMGLFTGFILWRIAAVLHGASPLNNPEAAVYASAVGAFAYSNHGGTK